MNKKQKEVLQSCLDIESRTLKGLKQTYKQALRDCNQKIRELSSRTDMENLQSVIYQKQYQEALKRQLEGVMANLQSGAYAKISDYLAQCYQNGFVGTMYYLAGQGIPLIIPVDKNAIAKAIQLKSKLSKSLYDRLGEDVGALKKSVSSELSRGIAAGLTWNEVAGNMSRSFKHTPFNRAYNNSVRIARTEGHRVQVQSTMDAQRKAKSKGADMVKQWDATLDSATRDAHRELDGKIAEIDDDFKWSGGSVSAPGMFGDPAQDCNCRCALLSRARWALDDDELKTLQDRATYFGIDKSEDFEDYKKKYLNIGSNYAKASDVFLYGDDLPGKTEVTPDALLKHLEKSEVGREAIEYIEQSGIKPRLIYEPQTFTYRGEQMGDIIKIYMANITSDRVAAQTVIHEITHHKYGIGGCQWAEAVCMAKEKMHKENRNYLTAKEIKSIVKLAVEAYPEYKWKKGGYKNGKYF